jgi:hypothetical protein
MIPVTKHEVELWADDLYLSVKCKAPPVDLYALARHRRVKRVGLRLMVNLGALVPVQQGFEVFLQGTESQELDMEAPEPPGELTARQRFTLAHEIAHTFFYKGKNQEPVPTFSVKTKLEYKELEEICDRAAKRILVPRQLLRNQFQATLGESDRIDVNFVRKMVSRFKVSYEVMLDRLRTVEPDNVFARCILLIREERGGGLKVTAWYMGMGLLSMFQPIVRNALVMNWFSGFPQGILERDGIRECNVVRKGRELLFQKTPLRKRGDFLLQIDDLGRIAPSSN